MEKPPMDYARNFAEDALRNMPGLIDKIRYRRKPIHLGRCYLSLSGHHIALGIFNYFVEGNSQSFKQHLYMACKLKLAYIDLDSYQTFEVGDEIFYALFSDNPDLINTMANLETPELLKDRHHPSRSRFRVHMWQLAILGDYESLQAMVAKLAKNGRKADRVLAASGQDFFSLLMRGDKQGLEDLIHIDARIKSADPLTEDFMSFLGCLEAKLCWFKGIPVQIDSPLVPMELMPVKPLDYYDDVYDFLKPDWEPPPQGLLGKISQWLK